jgi:hypothetical protein
MIVFLRSLKRYARIEDRQSQSEESFHALIEQSARPRWLGKLLFFARETT